MKNDGELALARDYDEFVEQCRQRFWGSHAEWHTGAVNDEDFLERLTEHTH